MRKAAKLQIRVPRLVEAKAEGPLAVTLLSVIALAFTAMIVLLGR